MENNESSASARVTAAKTVLEMAFKAVELEDLEARVTALEHPGDIRSSLSVNVGILEAKMDVPGLSHLTDDELSEMRTIHETANTRRDSERQRQ